MRSLIEALWLGLSGGAFARTRDAAPTPPAVWAAGSIHQALYGFGFEVANALVYGPRR